MPKLKVEKQSVGAPTKLNRELIEKIVKAMMMGAYVETAAAHAGINKETFYRWLKQGARELQKNPNARSIYAELSNAVSKAFADAELRDVENIDKHAIGVKPEWDENGNQIQHPIAPDWKASAWRLERKFPKRWGRTTLDVNLREGEQKEDEPETFNDLVTRIANAARKKD